MTAHEAYIERHAEAVANLKKIEAMLAQHAIDEANDQYNWGNAGDLGHFNNLFRQILGTEE